MGGEQHQYGAAIQARAPRRVGEPHGQHLYGAAIQNRAHVRSRKSTCRRDQHLLGAAITIQAVPDLLANRAPLSRSNTSGV